jgi:hypothetical protein
MISLEFRWQAARRYNASGRSVGATTMRDRLQKSIAAATAIFVFVTFPNLATAGVVITGPNYGGYNGYYYDYPYTYGYVPFAYGYYYLHGYNHPAGGYYYPRAYRRQYNRTLYRGYW